MDFEKSGYLKDEDEKDDKEEKDDFEKDDDEKDLKTGGAGGHTSGSDNDDDDEEQPEEVLWGEESEPQAAAVQSMMKKIRVVAPDKHVTSERITTMEAARAIGDMARYLDNGAPATIDTKHCRSSLEIAYKMFVAKRMPLMIRRYTDAGTVEEKPLSEMILPEMPPLESFLGS